MHAKEGLALINGTQFILSHAITALTKMRYLLDLADLAGAMSIEGMQGSESPFRAELHNTRPFKGNLEVASSMRYFFKDSAKHGRHMKSVIAFKIHIHCVVFRTGTRCIS